MYHNLRIKILYDDKVEPPVFLPNSMVQMCTVSSRSPLSPSHTNPREMAQLNATICAVCGEQTSIQLVQMCMEGLSA